VSRSRPAFSHQPLPSRRVVLSEREEASLATRARDGETRAFDKLVESYARIVYNLVLRMVGDREDAKDLTQNTFLKAWRSIGSFDPGRKFFSWIYRIALNEAMNLLRSRRPRVDLDDRMADPRPSPAEQIDARDTQESVQAALAELGDSERQILVLRYFGELSYEEIADFLEIPEKTVKSRLFSARQEMGRILKRQGYGCP